MRMDVLSKGERCDRMFTRSGNWEKNKDVWQTKYMVGVNI